MGGLYYGGYGATFAFVVVGLCTNTTAAGPVQTVANVLP